MKILVTGATGNLGSLVIEELLKLVSADRVVASVRDPQKAQTIRELGVEVRHGDFSQAESLATAFEGIDRLLLISGTDMQNRVSQHKAAIEAAKNANVTFIAYTSAPNAKLSSLSLAKDHRETEEAIQQSGIPYSILRNNWYLENEVGTFRAVLNGAPWATNLRKAKIGYATRRDFAEAAAKVLAGVGHDNTVYELSGKPITQAELANFFAEAMNVEPQVVQVDDEAYAKILAQAGLPEAAVPFFIALQQQIRGGELDFVSQDLERVLGHSPTPLAEGIRQLLN